MPHTGCMSPTWHNQYLANCVPRNLHGKRRRCQAHWALLVAGCMHRAHLSWLQGLWDHAKDAALPQTICTLLAERSGRHSGAEIAACTPATVVAMTDMSPTEPPP